MAVEHFSHEHPLVLKDVDTCSTGEEVVCSGCQKPVIIQQGSAYTCSTAGCNFYLHKKCAELPKEIKHPMHQKHPLTLLSVSPYRSKNFYCNICRFPSAGFTYNCFLCEFDVDVNCAFEECSFHHQSHDHKLTLIQRCASFCCDGCGSVAEDLSYRCTICPFWVHKSCALAPSNVNISLHKHPLTLSYFIPELYRTFTQYCTVCRKKLNPSDWLYMCAGCRFFSHVKCVTKSPEPVTNDGKADDQRDVDHHNLVSLPMPDESSVHVLILHQFFKRISPATTHSTRGQIRHSIHNDHPLVLFDQNIQRKKSEFKENDDNMMICDGCVKHISPVDPYYACVQCSFFLHKVCVEFSTELKSSFHPEHPLRLLNLLHRFDYERCSACQICSSGFFFGCPSCKIFLDVSCAALPSSIKHEAHEHPLVQSKVSPNMSGCSACQYRLGGMAYGCETCNFHIDTVCALLPGTARHRWDPHPIPLVYFPIHDHPDLFYCEICEEEINTNYWLYFCGDCDQAFHTRCIRAIDICSNVKFGSTHKFDNRHPHSLTFVRKRTNESFSTCAGCGESVNSLPVLECAPCKYLLCLSCARLDS